MTGRGERPTPAREASRTQRRITREPATATGKQLPVRVLIVNAGSSSLKLRVLGPGDKVTGSADLLAPGGPALRDTAGLAEALDGLGPVDAVGHRVVHGGTQFCGPVVVTEDVR